MLRALDLSSAASDQHSLIDEFSRLGLKREWSLYALKRNGHDGQLLAVAMVNLSDVGLNLSDLTNCITLFVLDQGQLSPESLRDALSVLVKSFDQEEVPVLIYPEAAAERLKVEVEKRYVMWSLMPHFSDGFHRHTDAILRRGTKNGGSHDKRRSASL